MRHPVQAFTEAQLKTRTVPGMVPGRNMEVYGTTFYDTGLYVSAATQQLEFFTTARANRQLTNLATPGSLPSPQYFMIYGFQVDYHVNPAASAIDDLWQLIYGNPTNTLDGMPTFRFVYADKEYGPWPLSALHGTGAITGFTTVTNTSFANNYIPDGGFFQDGGLLLAPNQGFRGVIEWSGPVTLTRGNTQIRVTMNGSNYRKIT